MLVANLQLGKLKKFALLVSLFLAVFLFFNISLAQAQAPNNYNQGDVDNINLPEFDLIQGIVNVINWVLGFLGLIAVILVLYAGFLWMTAGGSQDKVQKAKKILVNALIGLVIILSALAIVNFVFSVLEDRVFNNNGGGNGGGGGNIPGPGGGTATNNFIIEDITTTCENPPDYNSSVYLCSAIVLHFNRYVDENSLDVLVGSNELRVQQCEGSASCNSPVTFGADFSGDAPSGNGNEWVLNGRKLSFIHQNNFQDFSHYQVVIPKNLQDISGENLDDSVGCGGQLNPIDGCTSSGAVYVWDFQTGDQIDSAPPTVTKSFPIDQSDLNYPERSVSLSPIIWARFSEGLAPWTINKNNIRIRPVTGIDPTDPDNSGTPGTYIADDQYEVSLNSTGNRIEISGLILSEFVWYQIEVQNIEDLCNRPMVPKTWRFQTSNNAPGVSRVYPSEGYSRACPDTNIFIIFNTSMYSPESGSCAVGSGMVSSGNLSPATGRTLRVVDNYPGGNEDPNNYCREYEFVPRTNLLTVGTLYNVTVDTNLIIDTSGNTLSKNWNFSVASPDTCANAPVITSISPTRGPDGSCLTIFGYNLDPQDNGQNGQSQVTFDGQNLSIDANAWSNRQIGTVLPSPSNMTPGTYTIQVIVDHEGEIGTLSSNEENFVLTDEPATNGPCLYSISPDEACYSDTVRFYGTRFDSGVSTDEPQITFTPSITTSTLSGWSNQRASTQVPGGVADGNVVIANSLGTSNPLNFNLSCGSGTLCHNDIAMCSAGDNVCASGYTCQVDGNECRCQSDGTTPTNPLSDPRLLISRYWPRSCNDACQNTSIGVRFNHAIDQTTLTDNNVRLFSCTSNECPLNDLDQVVSKTLNYTQSSSTELYQLDISPQNNLNASTTYRVIISDSITDTAGQNISNLNFISNSGQDENSFSWTFKTKDEICQLSDVGVSPKNNSMTRLNSTQRYFATAYGNETDNCDGTPLNANNYDWTWYNADQSVATLKLNNNTTCTEDDECASGSCLNNLCEGLSNRNIATALGNGTTTISVSTGSLNTSTELYVNDPVAQPPVDLSLLNLEPTGDLMCTNIVVSLLLNQPVRTSTINKNISLWQEKTLTDASQPCAEARLVTKAPQKNKNFLAKIKDSFNKFFQFIGLKAQAATKLAQSNFVPGDYWCKVSTINKNKNVDETYDSRCATHESCSLIKLYPNTTLATSSRYLIQITGGTDGLLGSTGGQYVSGNEYNFRVNDGAEICALSSVRIHPGRYTFTEPNVEQNFVAESYANTGVQIESIPGVYEWDWSWSESDPQNIIYMNPAASGQANERLVGAYRKQGRASLIATASTTAGYAPAAKVSGSANINNQICLNPWPSNGQPYQFTDGYANFSLFYCRDRGTEIKECVGGANSGEICQTNTDCGTRGVCTDPDDLPALNESIQEQSITNSDPSGLAREYLLLRQDGSTDAIGLRIYKNNLGLSPQLWYQNKNFTNAGSPGEMTVDGYQAIKDGRSIYVSASTLSSGSIYTNIYLMSYNQNATEDTLEIYKRLLNNWEFNINSSITNNNYCQSEPETYCTSNYDCPNFDCSAMKDKLIRDTKRVTDLNSIKYWLHQYYKNSSTDTAQRFFPVLEAGTYQQHRSTSKWPSWQTTFVNELSKYTEINSLPEDPLNKFNLPCSSNSSFYDPESCWNESQRTFTCPLGSNLYQYTTDSAGQQFNMYANMEYEGPGTWYIISNQSVTAHWQNNNTCLDFHLAGDLNAPNYQPQP